MTHKHKDKGGYSLAASPWPKAGVVFLVVLVLVFLCGCGILVVVLTTSKGAFCYA